MKKILLFTIVVLTSFVCWAQDYPSLNIKKTYYVSSSMGDDRNPGTESSPLKSISAIGEKKDIRIMLKRGDVFFDRLYAMSGCEISAYGEGSKPIICGFKILRNTRAWERVSSKVWRLDLTKETNFIGYSSKNTSNKNQYNNIGVIYDWKTDIIHANMVAQVEDLQQPYDYHTADKLDKKTLNAQTFKYLYMYYNGRPSELGNLCFSVGDVAVDQINNCLISNIAVVGWGVHGVNIIKNSKIINCDIDIIGGSLHTTGKFGRLGNGIQVWVGNTPTKNVLIEGCQITRTYDTATTIQGTSSDVSNAENIQFRNNRIAYCRQAFERYLHNDSNHSAKYINCCFSDNLVYKSGDNKFGLPAQGNNAHLLSYENDSKRITISNNTFFDGNYYFASYFAEGINDNRIYIYPDQYLNNKHAKEEAILAGNADAKAKYRKRSSDSSKVVVLQKNSQEAQKIEKDILERLSLSLPIIDVAKLIQSNK